VPVEWVLFRVLTIGCGTLTIKMPSIESRVLAREVVRVASVLLFGPHVGAVTLALDGVRCPSAGA
jgi:hypothetical protein